MATSHDEHTHQPTPMAATHGAGRFGFSRRALLAAGVSATGIAALGVGGAAFSIVGQEKPAPSRLVLSLAESAFITAVADALFPVGNPLGVAGSEVDVVGPIDSWVSEMATTERRAIAGLFHLLDQWPRLSFRSRHRFSSLDVKERVTMLQSFDESSVETRRALGQLMRALVSMPFFEDERVLAGMGMQWGCTVFE